MHNTNFSDKQDLEIIQKELPKEKSEIELLTEQLEEQKNKYLRALADFDNFKKRTAMEQESFIQFANERLIKEILPALDNLERAFQIGKSCEDEFIKGISLVKKQLEDSLRKFGVAEIKSVGLAYDPNIHEAILQKESDKEENIVLEEIQKGYILNGRLLRPAMVIVSKRATGNG